MSQQKHRTRSSRNWTARVIHFVQSEGVLARILRMSAAFGLAWTVTQFADRFELTSLPKGTVGITLFVLTSICIWLATEIGVLLHSRPIPVQESEQRTPQEAFADSLLKYARALAGSTPPRDHSLLELRSWTSRLLHLTGNHRHRQELGQIALTAAFALQDRRSQAAILIDDLGWSAYESGDIATATENITEAIDIIDDQMKTQATPDPTLIDLKCKALRHVANIHSRSIPLSDARKLLSPARSLAEQLSDPLRLLNLAQLEHSEAQMILGFLETQIGKTGHVDPSGVTSQLLNEGVRLVESAEGRFGNIGDLERQAKALELKVQLLAHDARKQRYRAAAAQLERLRMQVARSLKSGIPHSQSHL